MNSLFGKRTHGRSQALQLLFQAEANGRTVEEVLSGDYALSDGPLTDFGRELALLTDAARHDLDAIIATRSKSWALHRINAVDRNLMRLALYEMLYSDDINIPIAIDECVELAKAYGTDESSRFVNGLLGEVADDLEAGVDVVALANEVLEEQRAEEARRAAEEAERIAAEEAEEAARREAEGYDDGYGYDDDYDDYGYGYGYGDERDGGDAEPEEPRESKPYGYYEVRAERAERGETDGQDGFVAYRPASFFDGEDA